MKHLEITYITAYSPGGGNRMLVPARTRMPYPDQQQPFHDVVNLIRRNGFEPTPGLYVPPGAILSMREIQE